MLKEGHMYFPPSTVELYPPNIPQNNLIANRFRSTLLLRDHHLFYTQTAGRNECAST